MSTLAELAAQLLACADPALLDAPLDALHGRVDRDDACELLRAIHESGEASSLRELLDAARLGAWIDRSATPREEDALRAQLRLWVGAGPRGADDPARLASVPPLPRELEAILVWAREHALLGELSRPAREVLDDEAIPPRASLLACALGEVQGTRESLLAAQRIEDEARAHLMREAAEHRALAVRSALWDRVPGPGPLRALSERLRACIAGSELRVLHPVRFLPARPVSVDDERGIARGWMVASSGPFAVRLHLAGHEHRAIEGECETCSRPGCVHVRALAARLLDACLDERDRLHVTMRDLVAVPSWRRFLDAVAEPGMAREAKASERLAFRVRVEGERVLVGVVSQRAQADGGWTAGRLLAPLEASRSAACTDRDRRVLDPMTLATRTMRAQLVSADAALLRALAEHPLVQGAGGDPLRLVEQQPELVLDELPGGLVPKLRLAGAVVPPGERHRDTSVLFHEQRASQTLAYCALTAPVRRWLAALATFRGVLPPESHPALAPQLAALEQIARVSAPEAVRGSAREAPRTLLLRIVPGRDEGIEVTLAARALASAPPWPPGQGPAIVFGLEEGVHVHARRDLPWERETADRVVEALGLERHVRLEPFAYRIASTQCALELLSALASLSDLLEIEWAERGRIPQVSATVRASDLDVQVRKKGSWLTVEGRVRVAVLGTELAVGRVLDAARRGERFVRVRGQDHVEIERDLFERLARAQHCALEGVKLPAVAIDLWEREVGAWTRPADDATREWLERARSRPQEVELDVAATAHLRGYQRDGVAWMIARSAWAPGVCLADDMGLGKTVQAIALLAARASLGPALVVAPTSVVEGWARELARFAPSLRVHTRDHDAPLGPGDVVLTSYDLLLRDRARFAERAFATQIVDEAQTIKNARTQRARAVAAVDAAFRVALSGTPVENHLGDLWSLFSLIAPGLLGGWARFRARFAVPIQRYANEERVEMLRALIAPFVLRRTKAEVARELPSRTEIVHRVELSPAERALYDGAVHQARRALGRGRERSERTVRVLAEITRLRQLACHPQLVVPDERLESSKLHALVALLRDVVPRGHRVLVFSQFTRHLALVQRALDEAEISTLYLDGATSPSERTRRIDRFQAGEASVFLISLKAGGTGLNLTAADYVVHMDPWWNPAAEDQASDRAHRIGQERPITIVRLVAEGTIEERVLAMHEDKRRLAGAIVAGGAPASALDLDALESLIART